MLSTKLELARQQRQDGQLEEAEQSLLLVLNSGAEPSIHRSALLELALVAQDNRQLARAQQMYAQFVQLYREDPGLPEILLRQGLLYREMGAPVLALSKFYAVMSSALTLKLDRLAYYQRLVLQAQTEIAETYYLDGRFVEAADFFNRLLKLDGPQLNREQILCKLTRSWSAAGRYPEALAQARLFLELFPKSEQVPEMRFLLAGALKHLGHPREAMAEVLGLLQAQRAEAKQDQELRLYWQQRAGNELANQLYESGSYLEALEIYLRLAEIDTAPQWRLPAWYQAGLVYERLKQPEKALDLYQRIQEGTKDFESNQPPTASLKIVLEMARWRREQLDWQSRADSANLQLSRAAAHSTEPHMELRQPQPTK